MEITKKIPLNTFLTDSLACTNDENEKIRFLFRSGIQDFITLLSALFIAGVKEGGIVPPGFTGRFSRAYSSPTLGGIFNDFLLWGSAQDINPALRQLSFYLKMNESGGTGWFGKMISLRNKYVHSEDQGKYESLLNAISLISTIPSMDTNGVILIKETGEILWESEGFQINLHPFMILIEGKIYTFNEFDKEKGLIFSNDSLNNPIGFNRVWTDLRLKDSLLQNPSLDEIKAKSVLLNYDVLQEQNSWWTEEIFSKKGFMRFIEPGSFRFPFSFFLEDSPPVILRCHLQEDKRVEETICITLGIAPVNNLSEMIDLLAGYPFVVCLSTSGISSRKILNLLLWAADYFEKQKAENFQILIERSQEDFQTDQDKLIDRIPDTLDIFMCRTPGSRTSELKSFYWNKKTKKNILGIF